MFHIDQIEIQVYCLVCKVFTTTKSLWLADRSFQCTETCYSNIIKTEFNGVWVELFLTYVYDEFKVQGMSRRESNKCFFEDVFLESLMVTTLNLPHANCASWSSLEQPVTVQLLWPKVELAFSPSR